jgi:hypothetical protein
MPNALAQAKGDVYWLGQKATSRETPLLDLSVQHFDNDPLFNVQRTDGPI